MRKEELETILRFDAVDECWYAWSTIKKHIGAMKKRGWTLIEENEDFAKLKAPACGVKISSSKKPVRKPMSEEQKEAMIKYLAEGRELKKQ